MKLFLMILLALSVVAALMCIIEHAMIYTERATERVRTIDILHSNLPQKTRTRLLLRAAGLLFLAAAIIGGAVFCNLFFFRAQMPLIPVLFLAASALLIFLLIRHIRYVRYLILCCAMQAVRRQHEKTIAKSGDV